MNGQGECLSSERIRDRDLVEERWRGIGVDGRIVTCSIYRIDGPGLEVRVGYSAENFQRIRHVVDLEEGRHQADAWRDMVLAQGVTELSEFPLTSQPCRWHVRPRLPDDMR